MALGQPSPRPSPPRGEGGRFSMRFVLVFSILVFSACPPPTPVTPPLELSEPSWTLAGADGGTLTYKRGDDVLIALPPDAFQVGVVSRLEDNQSYDPYWLVVND